MTKRTKTVTDQTRPKLQPPVAKEAIVSIYPLELVADIAAMVFNGTDYIKAAKTAVALLDACQRELREQTNKRAIVYAEEEKRKISYAAIERNDNKEFVIKPFKEALRIVTGESREERAFPRYKRFLAHQIRQSRATENVVEITEVEAPTDEEVEASLMKYKSKGIRHDTALGQKRAFEIWKKGDASDTARKRALGGARRKK